MLLTTQNLGKQQNQFFSKQKKARTVKDIISSKNWKFISSYKDILRVMNNLFNNIKFPGILQASYSDPYKNKISNHTLQTIAKYPWFLVFWQ